jgi:putative transposase
LSTHWHALLDVPDASLSRGMHYLNSEYAKAFNSRHGRVGYLVRDRYWSRRKVTDAEVLTGFRYVAQNPVKAGIAERPESWFWSSFATTIGIASTFGFVDATVVLMQFGSSRAAAVAALRQFVDRGL